MMDDKGVSILEVLVGLLLLSLLVTPFIGVFIQSHRVRNFVEEQYDILYLVRNRMELIMSLPYGEAINYTGTIKKGNYLINTHIFPYSVETGGEAVYITAGNFPSYGDGIKVYAPGGAKVFPLSTDEEPQIMNIILQNTHYKIELADNIIEGALSDRDITYLQIDLIDIPEHVQMAFNIIGNPKIRVYSSPNNNWDIYGDAEFKSIDNSAPRDSYIYWVHIQVYKASADPLYRIENIISLKH